MPTVIPTQSPAGIQSAAELSYHYLMRAARGMFEPDELARLAPRGENAGGRRQEADGNHATGNGHGLHQRPAAGSSLAHGNGIAADPAEGTAAIAYDFLAKGGRHSRPFIVLAVYDALTGGRGGERLPLAVRRAALSIETFHKASLVHDDIEDDDQFRYGDMTLHRRYGAATAINVGDYLIGLGYRLVSRERESLGAEAVSEILERLADAHMRLTEGQGAELLWRDSHARRLTPAQALRIYALKTAPAFEAALVTGLRLAGPLDSYLEPIVQFAENLGIAFQILNDLGDWQADNHNKLIAAGDVLGGRPTVLWALALEGLSATGRERLEALAATNPPTEAIVRQVRQLYDEAGVFDKAERLVRQYESQARAVAEQIQPPELQRLLEYLADTVLKRPAASG